LLVLGGFTLGCEKCTQAATEQFLYTHTTTLINSIKVVWLLYIIVGFCAALAGMARGSYMSLGDPLSGDGMELACIIAVMLGGTRFAGGEGSVEKTIIGAIIIICVTVGMLTIIPAYWQTLVMGCVLILAVAINHVLVGEDAE
jgi:ribose/xylose/arabinose/galactoside ABC-type transport system permease subunit